MRRPLQPEFVYLDEVGQVSFEWDKPNADQFAFHEWLANVCPHGPMGEIVSHRLGNFSLIGYRRELLAEKRDQFPILLDKVVYEAAHAGDCINMSDFGALDRELEMLQQVHVEDRTLEKVVRDFDRQMLDLLTAARTVKKPIVFL